MMRALAESFMGVVIGEATAQGQRQQQQLQRGGGRRGTADSMQQQRQHWTNSGNNSRQQQNRPLASFAESITDLCDRALHVTLKGMQYLLVLLAVLMSAGVIYGALYWLVMPLRVHDKQLFFDYGATGMGGPTATVDFLAQHTQWDPSPLTRVERLHRRVLKPGQHYEIGLELSMPTSLINRRVGVFMVQTTLMDADDKELASSSRPAMLPHTSGLLKSIKLFFAWPLFLLGVRREADAVFISCMNFYEENASHPLTKARVTISSNKAQFYRASVHVTPQLKGLPWLMHDWFYTTLIVGVVFIASLEVMVYGFCYLFFFMELDQSAPTLRSPSRGVRSTTALAYRQPEPRNRETSTSAMDTSVQSVRSSAPNAGDLRRRVISSGVAHTGGASDDGVDASEVSRQSSASLSRFPDDGGGTTNVPQAHHRGGRSIISSGARMNPQGQSLLYASQEEQDAAAMASWTALREQDVQQQQQPLRQWQRQQRQERAAMVLEETNAFGNATDGVAADGDWSESGQAISESNGSSCPRGDGNSERFIGRVSGGFNEASVAGFVGVGDAEGGGGETRQGVGVVSQPRSGLLSAAAIDDDSRDETTIGGVVDGRR